MDTDSRLKSEDSILRKNEKTLRFNLWSHRHVYKYQTPEVGQTLYQEHSSAAEYLTFLTSTGDSAESIEMRCEGENIRLSERKFYQKITDIYATALDYDRTAKTTNNLAEYREAERIGRGSSNIKRENRKWIFAVYEEYQKVRQADGPKYDWDDLAY